MIIPRPAELIPAEPVPAASIRAASMPTESMRAPGRFVLPAALNLRAGPGAQRAAALLAEYLGPDRPRTEEGPAIRLEIRPGAGAARAVDAGRSGPGGESESYRLEIRPDGVLLTAPAEAGLFHGVQSLRQALMPGAVSPVGPVRGEQWWPCLTLSDAPLLPWRGVMLDVARHFMPLSFLMEFADLLALHKLNVLHLHLTDDQGWRVEIDGLLRLTEVGAWRAESMIGPAGSTRFDGVPHGGFYTARELRTLVDYAAARGVLVVPEIEMPGHCRAALAAYPNLGADPERPRKLSVWTSWGISEDVLGVHDEALDFCRHVLAAVTDIFPSPYIHLGGDECPRAQWAASPTARRRAAQLGLASTDRLHGWLLSRMHAFLAGHGRRAVSWDESAPGTGDLPSGMVLAAWLDPADAARSVARGHQVVMAPYRSTFLDYPQSADPDEPPGQPDGVTTLEDVYHYDPLAAGPPLRGDSGDVVASIGPGTSTGTSTSTSTDVGPRSGLAVDTATGEGSSGRLPVADPADPSTAGVLGTQAQLWTEFAPTPEHVRRLAFPRLCALAEIAWSGGPRDYADFRSRLARHAALLASLGALDPRRAAELAAVEGIGMRMDA